MNAGRPQGGTPTIGLSMIVKDEAAVILRCLASVRRIIDTVVIVDTGSQDGTQQIVRRYLAEQNIPGTVMDEPWRDFAHNRTAALAALRGQPGIDYALVMDADDVLVFEAGFDPAAFKAGLWADVYDLDIRHGETVYRRPQLFSNRLDFVYRSVLHEYLVIPPNARGRSVSKSVAVAYGGDGARSRDPETYVRDAALLQGALADETDPFLRARYEFYLAQSLRDCGRVDAAIDAYLRRAELGHWEQEVFESLLNAGHLMAQQGRPTAAVLAVLSRAAVAVPERAEAFHVAARVCRERGEHSAGLAAAERGLGLPQPEAGLFLRPWIYAVGLLDEYAVNAYWADRDMDCLTACTILLTCRDLDPETRARVAANRDYAYARLEARGSPWLETVKNCALRIAVVTPYGNEMPQVIERCIESVRRQSMPADHILIATGDAQDWIDGLVARHVKLGEARADGGDQSGAARAAGGFLAAAAGYAAICFLDTHCWYDDDHLESCLTAALAVGLDRCGFVAASRRFRRPDLTVMPIADEDPSVFVDASSYFLLPAAYGLIASWALVPAALAPVGDRVCFLRAKTFLSEANGGLMAGRTRQATVNCIAPYAATFAALGERPPAGAQPLPNHAGHLAWIEAQSPDAIAAIRYRTGVDLRDLYPRTAGRPSAQGGDTEPKRRGQA